MSTRKVTSYDGVTTSHALQEPQQTTSRVASLVTDNVRLTKGAPPTVQIAPSVNCSEPAHESYANLYS